METILKIRWISDLPKIVGFRLHSDSDLNSNTSLLFPNQLHSAHMMVYGHYGDTCVGEIVILNVIEQVFCYYN